MTDIILKTGEKYFIDYNSSSRKIKFKFKNSNSCWYFYNVPESLYNELIASDNEIDFINKHIKPLYKSFYSG